MISSARFRSCGRNPGNENRPRSNPSSIRFPSGGTCPWHNRRDIPSKAESALKNKSYDQAILNCTKAIEANANSEKAYAWRGYAYVEKRLYNQAIEDCTRAIQLKPIDTEAYNSRAVAYLRRGAVDRAISDWTTVIRLKPDIAKMYNNRAGAYILKHQYDLAMSDCNRAIAIEPRLSAVYAVAELFTMTPGFTTMLFPMPLKRWSWIRRTLWPTLIEGLPT